MNNYTKLLLYIGLVSSALVCPSDDFNLEKFLNSPPEVLRKRKAELVRREKQGTLKITPSEAQLFYPDPVENQKKLYGQLRTVIGHDTLLNSLGDTLAGFKYDKAQIVLTPQQLKVLNDVMAKEKQVYDADGLTVYHSTQPHHYAHSYVRTKVAELVSELQGNPVAPNKMLLLRDTSSCKSTPEGQKKLRKDWISKQGGMDEKHADYLLSCNIGVAGSTAIPMRQEGTFSSTIRFWLQKYNVKSIYNRPVRFKLDDKDVADSIKGDLNDAISQYANTTKTGTLLQLIFKDKALANKVMYNAYPGGMKREYAGKNVQETISALSEKPSTLEKSLATSPTYESEIPEYNRLENLQTRIALTTDKLLDASNPKVRKSFEVVPYTENPQALDEFHKKVDSAIDQARRNYLGEYRAMTLPQKFWHNVNRMFNRKEGYWQQKQIKKDSQHWFIAQ